MTSDKETDMLAKPPKSGGDISAWMAKWWQSGEIIPAKGFSTLTPLILVPMLVAMARLAVARLSTMAGLAVARS